MENSRKHIDVKLVGRWDHRYGAENYIAKPNFRNLSIFDENFGAIQLNKNRSEYG